MKEHNAIIEAWRGFAALLVLYTHYWAFGDQANPLGQFSHTGVDLFFVISGFVFGPYWWGSQLQSVRELVAFGVRRFFRIYPAYVAALLLYVFIKNMSGAPLLYVAEHLTFFHVQSREMAFYYNAPFWSLPAEVEFYLTLPLLCWLAQKIRGGFILLLGLAILLRIVLARDLNWETQNSAYIALHHLPGLLCEFMMGALAWRLSQSWGTYGFWAFGGNWRPWRARGSVSAHIDPNALQNVLQFASKKSIAALFATGLVGWLLLAQYFAKAGDEGVRAGALKGQMGWLASVCFALMVLASVLLQQRLTHHSTQKKNNFKQAALGLLRNLLNGLALLVGKVSYGVYLLHIAMLSLVVQHSSGLLSDSNARWVAAGLTLLVSLVMHELWEGPLRDLGRFIAKKIQGT